MAVMISLDGRALELARRMVDDGKCSSLEEAVGRSLAIAHLNDTAPDWDGSAGDEGTDVARLVEDVQRKADAGSLGGNAPELWRLVRAQLRSVSEQAH